MTECSERDQRTCRLTRILSGSSSNDRPFAQQTPMLRTLAVLSLLLASAASLAAQGPTGGGYGGGRHRREGAGGPRTGNQEFPTFDDINGPPDPETAARALGLDQSQEVQYATEWNALMAATESQRDTVREIERVVQSAVEQGYERGAREKWEMGKHLADTIRQRDTAFDHDAKSWMSKPQRKIYEDLRKVKDRRG
jgi:hypothetical protein